MTFKEINIGNVPVGVFDDFQHLLDAMFEMLREKGHCFAVAINPEKVMMSLRSEQVYKNVMLADIRYADGIGVSKALSQKTSQHVPRLPGCELWENLMVAATKRQKGVFLVGAKRAVLEQTVSKLKESYSTPIVGCIDGYFNDEAQVIEQIKQSGAEIVTVAMGSPVQEEFISKCRAAGIKAIFMGVGGTYDVFTDNVKRAPAFWRNTGLEWFYRLASQPTRWKRQLKLLHFAGLYLSRKL